MLQGAFAQDVRFFIEGNEHMPSDMLIDKNVADLIALHGNLRRVMDKTPFDENYATLSNIKANIEAILGRTMVLQNREAS